MKMLPVNECCSLGTRAVQCTNFEWKTRTNRTRTLDGTRGMYALYRFDSNFNI